MKPKLIPFVLVILSNALLLTDSHALPKGFVYLKDVDPTILQDMRYFSANNFVGRPIKGYQAAQCILTKEAALALAKVQQQLKQQKLGLKVYDCYRPQMAVDDFIAWSENVNDQKMKNEYYPNVDKRAVFKLGYVAMRSGHSRGSTVDLTVVHLDGNHLPIELKMGTHFDFMDETSHPTATNIPKNAQYNRTFLQSAMRIGGFLPLDTEWWHFTLKNEPFSTTYFNFTVR